ncbi:hypothetical protein IC582_012550 [Cucumis melo]|uniref:Protein NRT1/ PTR FAMILY 5.2-like n=1 Tax=Cucumis melo TaxID=3656 RepID=A0A9I9CNX0_CUCME
MEYEVMYYTYANSINDAYNYNTSRSYQGSVIDSYTQDGTVDLKGRPLLRSKTGSWKACFFIIVYELLERIVFHGVSANLIIYLTTKLHQRIVTASNYVTNWNGAIWIMPIFGAYIADAHLGRYRTFLISSFIWLTAMSLLTLAVSVPSLKPPPCLEPITKQNFKQASKLQLAVFFGSLYLLVIASGGTKPNISTMGADQFDHCDPKEKAQKLSFFNSSSSGGCLDNVGWSLGYGIPTIGIGVAIIIFVVGTPFYRHRLPSGSPFTTMASVIVAAAWNWRLPIPNDPNQLYELEIQHYSKPGTFKIDSTPSLRFLNKAAIRRDSGGPWRLCSVTEVEVTEVEETKQMLRMIPILICTFIPNTIMAQTHTLFIKQGTTLDRSIDSHFKIPPDSLNVFVTISMLFSILIYDRIFVKIMQRVTKSKGNHNWHQEWKSTDFDVAARENGSSPQEQKVLPLTIFTLLPRFILTGFAEAFIQVAVLDFFYDQAPENMKSLGTSYAMTSLGIGNFLSSLIVSKVSEITKRQGKEWILNNLNASHLDYFYALLAVMSAVNFFLFLLIS